MRTQPSTGDLDLLSRVIHPERADFTPEAASAILKLAFEPKDLERMHELAVKNQDGALGDGEQRELDSYCRVGRLLDMMHAKARLTLKNSGLETSRALGG